MKVAHALYGGKRRNFRGFFNGLCGLVLIVLFYNRRDVLTNPLLRQSAYFVGGKLASADVQKHGSDHIVVIHRRMAEIGVNSSSLAGGSEDNNLKDHAMCTGLLQHVGYVSQCEFLKVHTQCSSDGIFDYVRFFYCDCQNFSLLGYLVLSIWLVALFYLLGNTAADYFCCSLEHLSRLLNLAPTVAGVTLLPLGNGAPDVFASIAAFLGSGADDVGFNSVLGGALFVTCVVAGAVSLCVAGKGVQIDQRCFIRDVGFFLVTLISLTLILVVGRVNVWGATAFVSIYVVYAFSIAANEILRKHARRLKLEAVTPLLPVRGSVFSLGVEEDNSVYGSLLEIDNENDPPRLHASLPQWMWSSNVAIYSNQPSKFDALDEERPPWGWIDESMETNGVSFSFSKVLFVIGIPLTIPRRLTIPLVNEETWSKPFAVASASLAPILLVLLWNSQDSIGVKGRIFSCFISIIVGGVLGFLAYQYTVPDHPPHRFVILWVLGGFLMSIVWFYIIANELVSLLVAFGVFFNINPSILGLTVLAWGNSMGDLMSNIALALNGGDGVQIAFSGSYAGPMFNTLVGLGLSMLLKSWSLKPASFAVAQDSSLFYTLGFLFSGLIWALVVLPRNYMQPNRMLGVGLISLYLLFLSFRLSIATGILTVTGFS